MLTLSDQCVNFEAASTQPVNLSNIFYDNANQKICTVRGGGALGVTARGPTSSESVNFRLKDKGEIISIKLSLDCSIVAIQRSLLSVDFVSVATASSNAEAPEISQTCKAKNAKLIGIEWLTNTEILLITDHGLELYQVLVDKKTVKNLRVLNLAVNWFVYSPCSKTVVASTGPIGNVLNPFLVKSNMLVRLSKFEVELPASPQVAKLMLLDRDVTVATIYNEIYVLVLRHSIRADVNGAVVIGYKLNTADSQSKCVARFQLNLNRTGRFAIHVLDNLILVHHQSSKQTAVFDTGSPVMMDNVKPDECTNLDPVATVALKVPEHITSDPDSSYDADIELYSPNWVVFHPNVIIDANLGCVWHVRLQLTECVHTISNVFVRLKFLLHRSASKSLFCEQLKIAIKEKLISLTEFSVLAHYAALNYQATKKANANDSNMPGPTVLDQHDIYSAVLHPLIETEQKELTNLECDHQRYMSDIILAYIYSLRELSLSVHLFMHELLVECLVKCKEYVKLHQLLQYKVVADSKAIAFLLVSLAGNYPPSGQLALDMIKRLGSSHEEIIEIMLSKHMVTEALRYVESLGVVNDRAMKFVRAAWLCDDRLQRYAVFAHLRDTHSHVHGTVHFAQGDTYDQCLYDFQRLYTKADCDSLDKHCDLYDIDVDL